MNSPWDKVPRIPSLLDMLSIQQAEMLLKQRSFRCQPSVLVLGKCIYEYDYAQAGLSQPVSVDEGMDTCRSMLEATLLLPRLLSAKYGGSNVPIICYRCMG